MRGSEPSHGLDPAEPLVLAVVRLEELTGLQRAPAGRSKGAATKENREDYGGGKILSYMRIQW